MAQKVGIDFGTTNSLISVVLSGQVKYFVDGKGLPHPSVVAYTGAEPLVGKRAKLQLDGVGSGVIGNVIKSPKTFLGKGGVFVEGREYQPADIVRDLMQGLKEEALADSDHAVVDSCDFDHAVVSIPVAMDGRARRELRDAMMQAGIHITQFVHEPLAALYGHFRSSGNLENMLERYHNKLALVFDWGGGTLDLTLCLISNGWVTQIMNVGNNQVGGDHIDEALLSYVREQHLISNGLSELPQVMPGANARLLNACEATKIKLSKKSSDYVYVENYFDLEDENKRDIEIEITRGDLDRISETIVQQGLNNIDELLVGLKIDQRRIALCLATGGMINMPKINQRLLETFSIDRLEISDRGDKIISEGCAWMAADGCHLTLAKPVEIVEARQSYTKAFREGTLLPGEGEVCHEKHTLHIVDPRDGKAKIQLCRPVHVGKCGAADPRLNYSMLTLKVDSEAPAFFERIPVDMTIDQDLILTIIASSDPTGDADKDEIYDLEFGLKLSKGVAVDREKKTPDFEVTPEMSQHEKYSVCSRSNVTTKDGAEPEHKYLIPGECLEPFDNRAGNIPEIQIRERLYFSESVTEYGTFKYSD
ncbi:MAG: Hsp70 family protein [Endozoicomonas sp.]|uniref:Hsp70 family protein n=1 Tax=Endozoicomonas sp. TaxID=1892382 RepID=UPI003D9B3FB3